MINAAAPLPSERTLLIVEDDKSFLQRLARAMEGRGFAVTTAEIRRRRPVARCPLFNSVYFALTALVWCASMQPDCLQFYAKY